jgi:hypothetical protein
MLQSRNWRARRTGLGREFARQLLDRRRERRTAQQIAPQRECVAVVVVLAPAQRRDGDSTRLTLVVVTKLWSCLVREKRLAAAQAKRTD